MDKKRSYTGSELLLMHSKPHTYENFKLITKKEVLNICIDKGFLTNVDLNEKSDRYRFVSEIFERDFPSMILILPKIKPITEPKEYRRITKEANEIARAIIEDLSKSLMDRPIRLPHEKNDSGR
ncbi:hypothetical protein ACP3V5_16330 [Vibrio maritimus]